MGSGLACLCFERIPVICNLFISASSEHLKAEKSGSLKKSICGLPLHLKYYCIPLQMWYNIAIWWKFTRWITFLLHFQNKPTEPIIQPYLIKWSYWRYHSYCLCSLSSMTLPLFPDQRAPFSVLNSTPAFCASSTSLSLLGMAKFWMSLLVWVSTLVSLSKLLKLLVLQ